MKSRASPVRGKTNLELVLKDGSVYGGEAFGYPKPVAGEVVFNTGMVGYPESLTDPSYSGQILVLTYPLIGNYGVPGRAGQDAFQAGFESGRIQVRGLIVSEYSDSYSHWTAGRSLSEWMAENRVPGISGVDTRAITKRIRERGTLLGKIVLDGQDREFEDPNATNLVEGVSVREPVEFPKGRTRIALVDCGVKNSIIKALTSRNLTVLQCPWDYDFLSLKPHGVVLSNGPGDPTMALETVENVRRALGTAVPILGVCLGSQILGLAAGSRTYKLKYGHRSQNQPCVETGTRRCYITPQNHGYAIDADTLPEDWREWFYNNNDRSNEGIKHISKPFFGAQFHPEASPGPDDTEFLFDVFMRALR
jgi:carbamoyl-phosphate synthase small subunit